MKALRLLRVGRYLPARLGADDSNHDEQLQYQSTIYLPQIDFEGLTSIEDWAAVYRLHCRGGRILSILCLTFAWLFEPVPYF